MQVIASDTGESYLKYPQVKNPTGGTRWGLPSNEIFHYSRLIEIFEASPD